MIMNGTIRTGKQLHQFCIGTLLSSIVMLGLVIAWVVQTTRVFVDICEAFYGEYDPEFYSYDPLPCGSIYDLVTLILGWVLFSLCIGSIILTLVLLMKVRKSSADNDSIRVETKGEGVMHHTV